VVFSPDGNTLAVVNNQKVTLWNVAGSGRPAQLSTLTGHGSVVHTLAFGPDGRTVATGSSDRSAILWDVTDRTRPHRLTILSGQSNPVTAVTFSRDGRTLVTGGGEESWATVWDVARIGSPVRLSKIRLDDMRTVGSMAFLPGSGRLLILTDYGWAATHAEMWDLGELTALRADPIRLSCAIGQGGLTTDEWSLYIPEMPTGAAAGSGRR
jgi:WD40 repeat protein